MGGIVALLRKHWWLVLGVGAIGGWLSQQFAAFVINDLLRDAKTHYEKEDPKFVAVIMSTNGKAFTIPAEFRSRFGSGPILTSDFGKKV